MTDNYHQLALQVGYFLALFVDQLTGAGLLDQQNSFLGKLALHVVVFGVLLLRTNGDLDKYKNLLDEATFYDKQVRCVPSGLQCLHVQCKHMKCVYGTGLNCCKRQLSVGDSARGHSCVDIAVYMLKLDCCSTISYNIQGNTASGCCSHMRAEALCSGNATSGSPMLIGCAKTMHMQNAAEC